MSLVGNTFGNCWGTANSDYSTRNDSSSSPKPSNSDSEDGLSIKQFLAFKGKELKAEGIVDDADPSSILHDFYRENVSEGSGSYDHKSLRQFSSYVKVKPEEVAWFEDEVGPLSEDFCSTVFSVVLSDAMSAMLGDSSLALAFRVATKQ